jgi:hypothetical protein
MFIGAALLAIGHILIQSQANLYQHSNGSVALFCGPAGIKTVSKSKPDFGPKSFACHLQQSDAYSAFHRLRTCGLEGLRKTTTNLGKDEQSPSQDLNRGPYECVEVLTTPRWTQS